jgi:hypothetical protein
VDPAMGSGHFLVSAASYIAKFIATDPSYDGPLDWLQIERLVAERCIYGVDLNPMAVELARLALWLSTVRSDVPLTFLSNLRVGNSLVGADLDHLDAADVTLFSERLARDAGSLLARTAEVAELESDSGKHVHEKERLAEGAEVLRQPLHEYADDAIAQYFKEPTPMFHWEIEFPEVFLSAGGSLRSDRGFDAVVGNPPYIRIQSLGRDLANWCRRRYEVAHGSFDAYLVFIERSVGLLAKGGRLGFIVPNKFMKLDSGRRLRQSLGSSRIVEELIDFSDSQVFEGATNYTSILILAVSGLERAAYRKLTGIKGIPTSREIEEAPLLEVPTRDLRADPWILAAGKDQKFLQAMRRHTEPLSVVTETIFTGLQTSADAIYILQDRGPADGGRLVFSKAADRELILESDLLHPLAGGSEVGDYAFKPQSDLLLFPYQRKEGMPLVTAKGLENLPLTKAYLEEQEEALRGRERGRMNHSKWYAYVYPKSLGLHDLPKLGIPRLTERLRASADPSGSIYLDNVDVNGIIPSSSGPSIWVLLCLLNSSALNRVFKLFSVPFRGSFYSANKQFIAPLPIRIPDTGVSSDLEALGKALYQASSSLFSERAAFRDWLGDLIGVPLDRLAGHTKLGKPDELSSHELLSLLLKNQLLLSIDPAARYIRDHLVEEHEASRERIAVFMQQLENGRTAVEEITQDLYEIPQALRG